MDVDGVLTDGRIVYDDNGVQTKEFSTKDGLGIRLLMDFGVQVGIITGRESKALYHRCNNLGIDLLFQGVKDKTAALNGILKQTGISARETAFIGDDLPDLSVMKTVGLPIAVADAQKDIILNSKIVTAAKGGYGAVREVCEAILKAKNLWPEVINRFSS